MEVTETTPLTKKDKALIDEYFYCGCNGTEAYMRLHPKSSYDAARSSVAVILAKPNVRAEVARRFAEKTMQADEALSRLSEMARGDLGDFTSPLGAVDWVTAKEKGLTRLVKKWKVKTITINGKEEDKEINTEEVELYDAQAALEKILRVHGKFTDKLDVTSDGKPLTKEPTDEEKLQRMKELAVAIAKELNATKPAE